ncbi:CDP-glycerol glycerophosphotransferase family protein [Viridibacillus arvi]|uniref:CDP-glycerol glycerophosphotransferase family protein n=1 Tax=Viridibacillus arvi TaxID=263475 RepID=UPI003D2D4BDA
MLKKIKKSKFTKKLITKAFRVLSRTPRKKNLVVFESFHGKRYSDNPRAIYEYMKENNPEYTLIWSVTKDSIPLFEEMGVPYMRRFSLKWLLNFPRAEYWVNNVRLPKWMPRPKQTTYLQTWHGTPLKKLGTDIEEVYMPGTKTNKYRKNIIAESKNWNYLIAPNAYSGEILARAFHFKGKVIESGYPRNDALQNTDPSKIEKIRKSLNIPEGKKIVLYAPTWRDDQFFKKGKYKFEFQFDIQKLKEQYGDDFVLLARMHYLVSESFDFAQYGEFIKDVSNYYDIADLYLVSDLLITDYSSVFFDYAILDRPIIFYMYDLEDYRDRLRGFYIDIEADAPGLIVKEQDELFTEIGRALTEGHHSKEQFDRFAERFCEWEDGKASERVVNEVFKK